MRNSVKDDGLLVQVGGIVSHETIFWLNFINTIGITLKSEYLWFLSEWRIFSDKYSLFSHTPQWGIDKGVFMFFVFGAAKNINIYDIYMQMVPLQNVYLLVDSRRSRTECRLSVGLYGVTMLFTG